MKKIILVVATMLTVVGIAFAGTRYIKYSCGHTEKVGSVKGNKDVYDESSSKCSDCQKKEKDSMCSDLYKSGTSEDVYKKWCTN